MKAFTAPEIEVIKFRVEDILTTSNETDIMPIGEIENP